MGIEVDQYRESIGKYYTVARSVNKGKLLNITDIACCNLLLLYGTKITHMFYCILIWPFLLSEEKEIYYLKQLWDNWWVFKIKELHLLEMVYLNKRGKIVYAWSILSSYWQKDFNLAMFMDTVIKKRGWMVLNATFNNISVISWWSILLAEETRLPGENRIPVAKHWPTLPHNIVSSTPGLTRVRTHNVSSDRHWLHR
jgi:hypothetical protein